jgi:hypothetical protein
MALELCLPAAAMSSMLLLLIAGINVWYWGSVQICKFNWSLWSCSNFRWCTGVMPIFYCVIGCFFGNQCYTYEFPYYHFIFAFCFAAYDEPYLLALLSDCVEIRTVEPCLFIQSVPLPKPRLVFRCHQGLVYVASTDYVWCLQAVPLTQQIHILLEDKQFQLALRLTVCTIIRMKFI